MNRTQLKIQKRQKAQQLAAIVEMRALVHDVARELYVAGYPHRSPADCIRAGIAFVDGLNSFSPAPTSDSGPLPPPELREAVAAEDARLDAEGEGRELAKDYEPGSTEEMEALS